MMIDFALTTETISNLCDIAGCLISALLVIVITSGRRNYGAERRILVGALLLLAGLTCNLTARSFAYMSKAENGIAVSSFALGVIRILGFWLLFAAVAAVFRGYALLGVRQTRWDSRRAENIYCLISVAAGSAIFLVTGSTRIFQVLILAELTVGLVCGMRERSAVYNKAVFAVSVLNLMALMTIYMIWPGVRLLAAGLAAMYVILYIEHMNYIDKEHDRIRLNLLMGQIYPHFIFNSLQTIKGLCDTQPDKAAEAIDTFSAYLRTNLESLTTDALIPFTDELEHTRTFLALEELSGARRIRVDYDLKVTDFMIPPLVLQPLVENAVKHGAASVDGEMQIMIETHQENERIIVKVGNKNAIDYKEDRKSKRRSVGLENVRRRLEMQCGGDLTVKLTNKEASAVIEIPLK